MARHHVHLGDAVEEAAEKLPNGWGIELCMERGSAFVRLEMPGGEGVPFDSADMTLTEQVMHATTLACNLSA